MRLREIASHRSVILVVLQPSEGEPVLDLLAHARTHHKELFDQMFALLTKTVPATDSPLDPATPGCPGEKWLLDGLSEFVVLGGDQRRRRRAKQAKEDRDLGLRVFFFRYGKMVVCTSGCYKRSTTPEGAVQAALAVRSACLEALQGGSCEIEGGTSHANDIR